MRRYSWLGVLLLALLSGSALAGKAGKVRKQIAAGDYAQAAESGRAWLEKHPEDSEVALLVAQADYLHATELNTMEAYEAFLSSWRSSPFHERVHEQMAHLAFAEIEAYPSIEGWQGFRRLYPGSSLVPESLSREEDLAWTDARQEGTAEGYAAFLEAYPSGRFRQAAEDREAELVWAAVVRADSLDGYMAFLRDYPHSDRVEEARVRSEDLAWDRAKRDDAIQTWRDFRHSYQGERAERAYDRELELSWTGALVHHEIPTYRSFELDYPETDEALLAEDREWDLYHYEREPYPGELRPSITRARRQEDGSYELWFDVIDAEGALVGGLHEEHFTVYDAGYEGEVVELLGMEHNRPVDVVFVVDISGSMSDEIDGVKAGIQRFASIMQLRSRDMRLGLVTFIEEIFTVNGVSGSAPLTANVPAFQRWVDRIDTNARGSEEDHLMALDRAAGLNFRKGAQKVLVLLSDEDATLRKRFRDPGAFGERLSREDFTVYSVTPRTRTFSTLVERTSGALFELPSNASFAPIMDALAQKVSKQYRLRYRRPPEAPPVTGDLDVVLRIRTDHAWLANQQSQGQSGSGYALVRWHPTTPDVVFFAGISGGLLCSSDGGRSLVTCGVGLPLTSPVTELLIVDDDLYARTGDGDLWLSADGGVSFLPSSLESGAAVALVSDPSDLGSVMASDGSMVWRHNGAFWSPVSSWEPDSGVVLLATHPTESLVLLTDGDGAMWRSSNGGDGFDQVAWTGEPPQGIAFHPSRRGLCFAWGPDGLWRSLDDGQTWRPLDLQGATVHGLLFDPTVRRLTLALTDQGVFASDDLGRSWYAQSTGLDGQIGSGSVSPRGRVLLTSPDNASVYGMERIANREFVFSSVFFASGAIKPNKALLPHLDEISAYLMRNRGVVLRVEGHTDSDGSEDSNQKLSEDRAIWVNEYLEKKGVAPHQLQAAGYGETRPLFPNDTLRNKARNRRVELVLVAPQPDLPVGEGMR